MALIKKLLLLALLFVGLILGIWFSTENTEPVKVLLFGFPMPAISVGVLVCGVLLLGAISGYLISLLTGLKSKTEALSLKRQLNRRDKELEQLRKVPVKG